MEILYSIELRYIHVHDLVQSDVLCKTKTWLASNRSLPNESRTARLSLQCSRDIDIIKSSEQKGFRQLAISSELCELDV